MNLFLTRSLTIVAILYGVLSGCTSCHNTMISMQNSPGGTETAFVFVRDCGATTAFSTHVSVLPSHNKKVIDRGNVLIIDDNHGTVPLAHSGAVPIRVTWLSEHSIRIAYPKRARVFSAHGVVSGVHVEFEQT